MKNLHVLIFVTVSCKLAFAGMAFPAGLPYEVEAMFRTVNPFIRWDESNYLVDISGPLTLCSKVGVNGAFDVKYSSSVKQKYGEDGVGGLVADVQSSGGTVSAASKDIRVITNQWRHNSEFLNQIRVAKKFGCSVQPMCRGRTVVGCLFTPKAEKKSGDKWPNDKNVNGNVVALTIQQYRITERNFRRINTKALWDRSHLLENLSSRETSCAMEGKVTWNYDSTREIATKYGYRVGLLFGSVFSSGDTDNDVAAITRNWIFTEEGRKLLSNSKLIKVGCTMIQNCHRKKIMISCLIGTRILRSAVSM